jgi:arabinofuranan 3-O-arabinosyltransferase
MPRVLGRAGWLAARPYLIVFAISSLIVSRWFRTGTFIASGDMGPFIRQGWAPEAAWGWNHQTTGAGSAGYTMARGFEFLLIWLCKQVGLTEYSAQWLFYTCIYGLVGFGIAYLAGAFVRSELGIIAAGTFGVLNGFFLTRLPNPLNIISVGAVALITGIAMRVAMGRRVPAPIAGFALMPTSFLAFNPPMLVVAYAWALAGTPLLAALVLGRASALRLLRWFVAAAPWALVLNAWWLIPLAQSYVGGGGATANATFTDPTNWSWSQINNSPPNILTMVANWAWFRPQYLPFAADLDHPGWIWIRYLLPVLVFLAPLLAPRRLRRLAFGLLALILVFVFLAKGLRPPLNQFNLFLYLHAPGFWLFREPMSKLGQLLVSFFGVLLAVGVEGALQRLRRAPRLRLPGWPRRFAYAGSALPLLLVLAYPYPLYTGEVMPDERPTQPSAHVRVPQEWWDVAERINADTRPGKVLVLPLDDYYQMPTTWGFFGADSIANLLIQHPVVAPKPGGYFGDVPGFSANVRGVETALLSGDLAAVPKLIDAIGVSKVIVRHDLVRGLPNRYFADDRILSAAMARVPGAELVADGTLQLWQFTGGTSPTVRTYDRVLDAPARAEAGAAVLGTVDGRTAIRARADLTPAPLNPQVDDTAVATGDVVHWPVPPVDSGVPSTTVDVAAGTYTLAQRARAAAVLVPRLDPAGNRLLLEDPAVVSVDGRPVSRRPALSVPLPAGRTVVAVRAGNRTVSLDGGAASSVPVGSATTLNLLAAAAKPADVTEYSPVFDCNNYEPRPWHELGLQRTVTGTGPDRVVRLTAADHAACTKVVVRGAEAGRLYRIRLQYRHVTGARPQICLWQDGASGCELTARPVLDDDWTSYERVVEMDGLSSQLQVILRADVGERLKPKTVTEYRGLRIDALETVATHTVFPPAVPEVTVKLTAGKHTLRVDGGRAGSILAPFEPLEDCFRYDDETPEQAGLAAETQIGANGETTYTLKAVRHLACIASLADDMGASSLYEFAMEARSVALRNPKFCLYLRGPDLCRTMPGVALWSGWTSYETLLGPDPNAVETRVYLYGLRDPNGKEQSQVEYRGVRLRPVATPSSVVLVRQEAPARTSAVDYHRENPTEFTGTVVTSGPTAVALAENAAPGWVLTGVPGARKVTLQGWMGAWLLPEGGTVTLRYTPARISRYALYLLPVAVAASLVFMYLVRLPAGRPGVWAVRHRRRRPVLRWRRRG